MAISVGTKAPDFTLYNTDKKEVSLKDFTGKTLVIHFFPAAFTGVCTAQLCNTRDTLSTYNDMDASVVGVSVDLPFSLKVFKAEQNLNFDLLSDFNKDLITKYDFSMDNFSGSFNGVAKRGVVVIDGEGIVKYVEQTENPGVQINFEALNEALKN